MSDIIMVCSGKGGVGKSTLSLYLAKNLAEASKRVLVADTDAGFGELYFSMFPEENSLYTLGDILQGDCSIEDGSVINESGFSYIAPPASPEYYPTLGELRGFVKKAEADFDYIIFDCPQGFSYWQEKISLLADKAIIVATPDDISARLAGKMSLMLTTGGIKDQKLIINMVPNIILGQKNVRDLDDVMDISGVRLLGYVPRETQVLGSGWKEGKLAFAMQRITQRLLGNKVELKY